MWLNLNRCLCVKSVPIHRFSDPFSVRMWQNTDQKNSEYRQLSRNVDMVKSRNHLYSFIFYVTFPMRTHGLLFLFVPFNL